MASVPILGTPDHIRLQDQELIEQVESCGGNLKEINPFSES